MKNGLEENKEMSNWLNYRSVIVEGSNVEELEKELNLRLKTLNYATSKVSSPSITSINGKLIAVVMVSPIVNI